jgi:transcription elongation factor GreA
MSGEPVYLTSEGAAKLRSELEQLRGPKRTEMAERLRRAVRQGDLSENADYIMAKEAQAFLEGRIQELELLLREAVVVDPSPASDQVQIGSTVVVVEDGGDPETFTVVGVKEAKPSEGRISHESPIGQALLGKRLGEVAEAVTPGGSIRLKILEIR